MCQILFQRLYYDVFSQHPSSEVSVKLFALIGPAYSDDLQISRAQEIRSGERL